MLMFYLDAKVLRKSPVSTLNPSNTSLRVLTVLQGFQGGCEQSLNTFNPEQSDGSSLMRDSLSAQSFMITHFPKEFTGALSFCLFCFSFSFSIGSNGCLSCSLLRLSIKSIEHSGLPRRLLILQFMPVLILSPRVFRDNIWLVEGDLMY
jgi:hypothetical protein